MNENEPIPQDLPNVRGIKTMNEIEEMEKDNDIINERVYVYGVHVEENFNIVNNFKEINPGNDFNTKTILLTLSYAFFTRK